MKIKLSRHAKNELERRKIPEGFVESVLEHPQQIIDDPEGVRIYQSRVDFGGGKIFLLRVFVSGEGDASKVATVYRTSKIAKYWRKT